MLIAPDAGPAEASRVDPDLARLPSPFSRRPLLAERAAWSLVWLAVLTGGVNLWGFWWWSPAVVALAPLMVLGGLLGNAYSWIVANPRSPLFQRVTLGAVIVTVLFPQSIEISTRSFYATDSAAFDQVAASALVHGADPYVASMSGVAHLLSVPSNFWTYAVDGGHVTQFSYPAGSFLLSLPATALGVHMAVDWTDLVAWLVTVVLLFALVPPSLRWLAALLGLTPFFLGSFTSGGTDALFLPFLVVAVWRWDRYGRSSESGLARWIGPISLGVACAIKQTPWFAVPMLATGIFLEARRSGRAPLPVCLRYLLTVLVVFAVLNLPFLAWHPGAWLHGTFVPLTGGLVADGQGLVTLATHGLTGGVNLKMLSLAGALALIACVAAFVAWYPQLKRIWPLLLTIPFFISPRSLSSYLVDLIPVALVAALSVEGVPHTSEDGVGSRKLRVRPSVLVVGASCVGVGLASFVAFSGPPLQLTVRSVITSHAGTELDAVTVSVVNRTSDRLVPHFLVNSATSELYNGFWKPSGRGLAALGPHDSETITLYPPAQTAAPRRGARWLVEAYTLDPAWLSTSPLVAFPPS
ncbi:MAG TPA: hypothetical protein VK386_06045 [Acidimicrobiales bacterium]|nr:hypothetical protein [Acidimicrobiales bacterium]